MPKFLLANRKAGQDTFTQKNLLVETQETSLWRLGGVFRPESLESRQAWRTDGPPSSEHYASDEGDQAQRVQVLRRRVKWGGTRGSDMGPQGLRRTLQKGMSVQSQRLPSGCCHMLRRASADCNTRLLLSLEKYGRERS